MCDGGDNGGNNGDLSSECVMEAIMEEIMEIYRVNVHARKAALNGKKWRIFHGEFCYFFGTFAILRNCHPLMPLNVSLKKKGKIYDY